MTESEWLACTDPEPMIRFLHHQRKRAGTWLGHVFSWLGRPPFAVSDRKLRLFVCAFFRGHWQQFIEERDRRAIAVAEAHADGLAGEWELRAALEAVRQREPLGAREDRPPPAYWATSACLYPPGTVGDPFDYPKPNPLQAVLSVAYAIAHDTVPAPGNSEAKMSEWQAVLDAECQKAAMLLREVIGNPFRSLAVEPPWLAWDRGVISEVARSIYEENRFEDLLILADALEDAGCMNADILDHCRGPGPHVRGCWVVDLILGKE